MILSIDPGPTESAYVLMDIDLKPQEFGKIPNDEMISVIDNICFHEKGTQVVIEMIASYGMPVGQTVFETCVWIGRFIEVAGDSFVQYIYRLEEKTNLCHNSQAKDSNITHALIDRFAQHDIKRGKGTKANPDWFYGFKSDIWAAYAVGVTYYDQYLKKVNP